MCERGRGAEREDSGVKEKKGMRMSIYLAASRAGPSRRPIVNTAMKPFNVNRPELPHGSL